jgi:hypothetical protein
MIDDEILKFYEAVRDPGWPDIQNYFDYCRLPIPIKQECDNLHNFQQRKSDIYDINHWVGSTVDLCVYKNLAFVPVHKCAMIYNTTLFINLGWEKKSLHEIDIDSTYFFGTMMHPMTRWFKGITEWLLLSHMIGEQKPASTTSWSRPYRVNRRELYLTLKNLSFQRVLSTMLVGDVHSMPYSVIFGDFLNNVNWIPMDVLSDNEVKISMMNFCKLHGHNISLPLNDKRLHESSVDKLAIFDIIKSICLKDNDQLYSFYKTYNTDLKFYSKLIELQAAL